jgi:hypothetical protein
MVLDCLGNTEEAFSQGAFQEFRQRQIRHDMDRVLLEKTRALARTTGAFDYRQLPKDLRIAIDSRPLEGAGRVEDTVNLLAHAGRKIVDCVADLLSWPRERVCAEAGIPLLTASSVKKALDYTWSDPADKAEAISVLVGQLTSLETWIRNRLPAELARPPLQEHVETLRQVMAQDLEPDLRAAVIAATRPPPSGFEKVSHRIVECRSRTRTCVTGARASGSTATSVTWREICALD